MKTLKPILRPIPEYQSIIAERVQVLTDTFGENDRRVKRVLQVVDEMTTVENVRPINWHTAACYVAWATLNPGEIVHEETRSCNCSFQTWALGNGQGPPTLIGWVVVPDPKGRGDVLRPCSRCNPSLFQHLYNQRESSVAAGQNDYPPPEEPPYDPNLDF